jgi:hypothetical protein
MSKSKKVLQLIKEKNIFNKQINLKIVSALGMQMRKKIEPKKKNYDSFKNVLSTTTPQHIVTFFEERQSGWVFHITSIIGFHRRLKIWTLHQSESM